MSVQGYGGYYPNAYSKSWALWRYCRLGFFDFNRISEEVEGKWKLDSPSA